MQYQHRSGLSSRPRNNDHTRWAVDETEGLPLSVWLFIGGVMLALAAYGAVI